MKIVIEHGSTKRKIEGPFNICGSKEDLLSLCRQIQNGFSQGAVYGWIKIHENEQPSIADTAPKGWEE